MGKEGKKGKGSRGGDRELCASLPNYSCSAGSLVWTNESHPNFHPHSRLLAAASQTG